VFFLFFLQGGMGYDMICREAFKKDEPCRTPVSLKIS